MFGTGSYLGIMVASDLEDIGTPQGRQALKRHCDGIKSASALLVVGLAMAGCSTTQTPAPYAAPVFSTGVKTPVAAPVKPEVKVTYNYTREDRECLKRAMYSESAKSDSDGYLAVGTVVANRLTSPAWPKTICGVVGQRLQFAPGVMRAKIASQAEPKLDAAADAILRGDRHPGVRDAMYFHAQAFHAHYDNIKYVALAGGNAFYEKRSKKGQAVSDAPLPASEVAMRFVAARPPSLPPFVRSTQTRPDGLDNVPASLTALLPSSTSFDLASHPGFKMMPLAETR